MPINSFRMRCKSRFARDEIVLAVNSRQARTQDQLHIHIGCLTARSATNGSRLCFRAARESLGSAWKALPRP